MRVMPVLVVMAGVVACEPPRMVCDGNRLGTEPELCLGLTTEQGQGRLVRTAFVGSRPIDSVSITNRGLRPLELRTVSFTGPREFRVKASWAQDVTDLSAVPATTITGGQRVFVQIEFAPMRVGTFEGKVTLESDAANQPTASFDVKGCAVPPGDDGTAPMACE